MKSPSTNWSENIHPDEQQRFEEYARQFVEVQKERSNKQGPGRALHRKQLLALDAELEVLPDLPPPARAGLFAQPGRHPALVRLSNGGLDVRPDPVPDVRGFAIKVFGVSGPSALGQGQATSQDFLLINHAAFSSASSAEFVAMALAAARGTGTLIAHMLGTHGIFGTIGRMRSLAGMMSQKFSGFCTESFHSAAPIRCGDYACKVRLLPGDRAALPGASRNWAADVRRHLGKGALTHDLQLQFFTDEATTPIEDASVLWPEGEAPFVTVARLHIQQQELEGAAHAEREARAEADVFDPWGGLEVHRPLGDVMRARKVVYFASQKERGVR